MQQWLSKTTMTNKKLIRPQPNELFLSILLFYFPTKGHGPVGELLRG